MPARPGREDGGAGRTRRRARLVAIGDLNAADHVLVDILRGTGLVDARLAWIAGESELVQVGDVWNRGGGARRTYALLLRLQREARRAGGRVTLLLGNHEAMTALGNEAYCTEEEYLSFATAAELRAWPDRIHRALVKLYREHAVRGPILPLGPRLDAWRAMNAPGQKALRAALGPRGRIGRAIRALPIAHVAAGMVFVHGGLTPLWARHGVAELNRLAKRAWASHPKFIARLPRTHLFRADGGPLWDRSLATATGAAGAQALSLSLALLGARRMVVGHTPTDHVPGGTRGHIALRHGGRLVCIDVGLGGDIPSPRTALVVEGGAGFEWRPDGTRLLWS